jgi:hypothetical protein
MYGNSPGCGSKPLMMGIMNTKTVVKIFAGKRIGTLVPHYRGMPELG